MAFDYEGTILDESKKNIEKYLALRKVQVEDKNAFYSMLVAHTKEILPYVYTPTVGEACQKYSHLDLNTTGLYITAKDKGKILDKLKSWPQQNIKVVVVTDGERILGLGDLGAGGMGISEGKILLYTAAAGVDPQHCLPICLDIGTNNESLLGDEGYIGLKQKRIKGEEYFDFIDEFVSALKQWQPHVLLQFEDFGNHTAFELLEKYRGKLCCFNDDIQGTAAITLAGILSATRMKKESLDSQTILFHGAGEAGIGCGLLIAHAMSKWNGVDMDEARKRILFMDSKGLVCASRAPSLQEHKKIFAHDIPFQPDLLSAIKAYKPTILIGVSTIGGAFTVEVIKEMTSHCERPAIFPLSNPTSKAECTFEDAFSGTDGKVIFASGSPFNPIVHDGVTYHPSQANNAYIFPAVGHAAVLCKASALPEEVFLEAAKKLSSLPAEADFAVGRLFPDFSQIRKVSRDIISHVAQFLCENNYGIKPAGFVNWEECAQESMYPYSKL